MADLALKGEWKYLKKLPTFEAVLKAVEKHVGKAAPPVEDDPIDIESESAAEAYFETAFGGIVAEANDTDEFRARCLVIWEDAVKANPKIAKLYTEGRRNKAIKKLVEGLKTAARAKAAAEAAATDPRPALAADTTEKGETADKLRALLGDAHRVFAFGGIPVTIAAEPVPRLWTDHEKKTPASIARPVDLNPERATSEIDKVARWTKVRDGIPTPVPTPEWAAAQIAKGGVSVGYPPLAGMLRHPAIAPGNKLVYGRTGYYPETCFYMDVPDLDGIGHFWSSPKAALECPSSGYLGRLR